MTCWQPHLSDAQKRELMRVEGLTCDQVRALERAVHDVAFFLQRSAAANDVRSELQKLVTAMGVAARLLDRWRSAERPSPGVEAFGHLKTVGAALGRAKSALDSAWQGLPDAAELVRHLDEVARQTLADAPTKRRSRTRASPFAISAIRDALDKPTDDASRAAAARLPVSRSAPSNGAPSFMRVAEVVFEAATGDAASSPERSIRLYLEAARSGDALVEFVMLPGRQVGAGI